MISARHFLVCWFGWLALLAGCQREAPPASQRIPPNPRAPAVYGPATGVASKQIARAASSGTVDDGLPRVPQGSLAVVQTELSPAILVRSTGRHLDLFAGTTNSGLAAPSYVAWSTMNGPRTFKRDEPLDVTHMEECWVLVWWAGAPGWTNWDSPWAVYLQHKPKAMTLDQDGLHLDFAQSAGDVVLFPLYGYEKLPQQGHQFLAQHGLTARKVQTWDWPQVLKRDPLTRLRYWAAVSREFPIYCEESISVDAGNDSVTIRSRFQWHRIQDEWKTPHLKLAPLPPPLGLAAKQGGFPVRFSKSWSDLDLFTPYGPYLGVEGVDQWEGTFSVLQYIHETEATILPGTDAPPVVAQARATLQQLAGAGVSDRPDSPAAVHAHARAIPYLDPAPRTQAIARLSRALREATPTHDRSVLPAWWAYAHFSGDWGLVAERWPTLRKTFTVGKETRWAGVGCDRATALGAAAASCVAFARLAYRTGDMDSYHYACAQLARELVLLFVKQGGADYFRRHQPWHSLEFMDEEVFLTQLDGRAGHAPGWQLDGPQYPAGSGSRFYRDRWGQFHDADLARFYRDYLLTDVQRELNWLQHRSELRPGPALVELRSLLWNEDPATLATLGTPGVFDGSSAEVARSCLAVLRAAHPIRFERLIPPASPSPFVAGLEREVTGSGSHLITAISAAPVTGTAGNAASVWPELTWPGWRAPSGRSWTFGAVRAARKETPVRTRELRLNWNTSVTFYQLESTGGQAPPN